MPARPDIPATDAARPAAPPAPPQMPVPQPWVVEACGDDLWGDDPVATHGPAR